MANELFIMLNILFKGLHNFALKRIIHALAKTKFYILFFIVTAFLYNSKKLYMCIFDGYPLTMTYDWVLKSRYTKKTEIAYEI